MDIVTPGRRSEIMSRIRSRDTKPELAVRRFLHACGLRFYVHRLNLPGTPDLVFNSRRICLFVHGCFWHGCPNCVDGTREVKSNTKYWDAKIAGNRLRDARNWKELEQSGWRVMVVWECEIWKPGRLTTLANDIQSAPRIRR